LHKTGLIHIVARGKPDVNTKENEETSKEASKPTNKKAVSIRINNYRKK
jgi:hypothetical protein